MDLLTLACVAILLIQVTTSPTVEEILTDPQGFEGREITLEGVSMGSDPQQTCLLMRYEQPLCDRDFVLHDGTGMIYVSTLMEITVNGEVIHKRYIVPDGREIRVAGIIELDDYGCPYLHADQKPMVL